MLKVVEELTKREQHERSTERKWEAYWEGEPQTEHHAKIRALIPEGRSYVDIGCGLAPFANDLAIQGKEVWATDIASRPLENLHPKVRALKECFPYSTLPDGYFDVAICADLIAELPEELYRLALSELARIVKLDGKVLISSQLDHKTQGAADHFRSLVQTEFKIEKERLTKKFFTCRHIIVVASKKKLMVD